MAYRDRATGQYPLTKLDVKRLRPNWSAPDDWPDEAADFVGVDAVSEVARPEFMVGTQRVVEVAPAQIDGVWTQQWQVEEISAEEIAENLATSIRMLIATIDRDVDDLYGSVIGNRASEYALAEQDADAYKLSGYTGTVPSSVASWASAKGQTAQWAADSILATAIAWRTAQSAIRASRLALKEGARTATTLNEISAVSQQWSGFLAAVRQQLGVQ